MAHTNSRPEEVAQIIKRRWRDAGLTHRDMGEVLSLDPEVVGRRLRGLTPFKIAELEPIADRLGVDVVIDLVERAE
jgi:hypothetical protein